MLLSAEIRWFWKGPNSDLDRWFTNMPEKHSPGLRMVHTYLFETDQYELGVKIRDSKPGLEVKALIGERAKLTLGGLQATAQLWTKVDSKELSLAGKPSVQTKKTRLMRKYDTTQRRIREIVLNEKEKPRSDEPLPAEGCNVELTTVTVDDGEVEWVTLGLEAFGSLDKVEQSLAMTVEHLNSLARLNLTAGLELNYPRWLARYGALRPANVP